MCNTTVPLRFSLHIIIASRFSSRFAHHHHHLIITLFAPIIIAHHRIVPLGEDGRDVLDKKINVQISNLKSRVGKNDHQGPPRGGGGGGDRGSGGYVQRPGSTIVHTDYKIRMTNLPSGADWRSIKDFLREAGEPGTHTTFLLCFDFALIVLWLYSYLILTVTICSYR